MRATRSPSSRALIAAPVALAMMLGACGNFARRGAVAPSPTKSVSYGKGITVDEPISTANPKGAKTGTLEIRVLDENSGGPLSGVTVRFRGPETKRVATGADGVASASLKPGEYLVDTLKCAEDIVIDEQVQADALVAAGGVQRGQLLVRYFDRRYKPTNSVDAPSPPPWNTGQTFTLAGRITDGCDFSPAGNVSLAGFRWRATGSFAIVETPKRAGGDGFARVRARCTAPGDGRIEIYHPDDPELTLNLLEGLSRPISGEWCS